MQLNLSWNGVNTLPVTTKIYRGDVQIDRSNLGVPVATVGPGINSWVDPNVVRGQRYYYVFEQTSGADRVVSRNFEVYAVQRTGPGPQKLIAGDMEVGYFGSIPSNMFFSTTELRSKLDLMAIGGVNNDKPEWWKFAHKGKILFMPDRILMTQLTWLDLYNKGLVYGSDDDGSSLYAGPKVNQLRTVKLGMDTFKVRLIKGGPDRADRGFVVPNPLPAGSHPSTIGSEWDDLMYRIHNVVPVHQRGLNLANMIAINPFYPIHCQELDVSNPSRHLYRGNGASDAYALATAIMSSGLQQSSFYWRPVLELIPTYSINLSL